MSAAQRSGRRSALGSWHSAAPGPAADAGRHRSGSTLLAGLCTVLAGGAGVAQLFLSWSSMVTGVGLLDADGRMTGWERYQSARTAATLSTADTITAYSVLGTALAGAVLILLGLAMAAPLHRRQLGVATLVLSAAVLGAAMWWLLRGHSTFSQTVPDLFTTAGPGWYLFLFAGPIGLVGAASALLGK